MNYTVKEIKKQLTLGNVRLGQHTIARLEKRGYQKKDILSCIWSALDLETQNVGNQKRIRILGLDSGNLPMGIVIAKDQRNTEGLCIITAFPAVNEKYQRICKEKKHYIVM